MRRAAAVPLRGAKLLTFNVQRLTFNEGQSIALDRDGPYRPVAEFWADYDAQQAAGKK